MKSTSETETVVSVLPQATVAVPGTAAGTDMSSVLAEIDAAMERTAAAGQANAPAPPAATSADRQARPSAVEHAASADTTRLGERDAPIRLPTSGGTGVGEGRMRYAAVPRADEVNQAFTKAAEFRSRLYWSIGVSDTSPLDPGSLTYEPYFGLHEKPFSLSSDPRFFFSHSSHGEAFDSLAGGIRRREGILVLTGEVGTGKTTLCRAVLQSLDRKTFAAYVPDPFLSREDLLKTLLLDFGVVSVDEIRSGRLGGVSRTDLSYPLYDFLASLQPLKAFAVVMIDEAQNLTTELLEEIRILSDLENRQKLLEVLLVGQPELQSRLASSTMRQLSQRVSIRCELRPLAREDVKPYVAHRLTIAGNDGRVQFTDAATDLVSAASEGIPRVINLVCDRALLRAASFRTTRVDAEHILWAIDDLRLPTARTLPRPSGDPQGADLESSPKECPEPEGADLLPASDPVTNAPGLTRPVAHLESFPEEFPEASAEREQRQDQPTPHGEGQFPAVDLVENGPGDLTLDAAQSPLAFSNTWFGNELDEIHMSDFPEVAPPESAFEEGFPAVRKRRTRLLALVAAGLGLATGFVGYRYAIAPVSRQQPSDALAEPAQPRPPLQMPVGEPVNPSPMLKGRLTGSTNPPPSETDTKVSAPAARFVLEMATFQSPAQAAQALQEFRDAGYIAYSIELSLRDGSRVLAVFLGPYPEVASAERDLDRARQIPGYGNGRLVEASPSILPPKLQP